VRPHPDLLRVEFLGLTVRHEEVALPRDELALLFAEVSDRYGLTRMELHSDDGATFSGADGAEVVLRSGTTASCSVTPLGFREGAERVAGVALELVAVWDCEDEERARELLTRGLLDMDDERVGLLGGDDVSFGLRIWRRSGDANVEVAVEPMHAEPGKVYLRLVHGQGEPLADRAGLREAVDGVHALLTGPLRAFLLARERR
jgi:hypothetical protein